MINRAIALGLVVASRVMLSPMAASASGATSARPQVRVIPPPSAGTDATEPDDLPGPPSEVLRGVVNVPLPPVPDFRRAVDGKSAGGSAVAPSAASEPSITVVTEPPMRKVVIQRMRDVSIEYLNACNAAIAARRYKAAIAACRLATAVWDGNHLAWYGWANAHMANSEWREAVAASQHAVALRPDEGMYQLAHGIALYETEMRRGREDRVRTDRKKADDATVDPAALRLGAARAALVRATALAPDLWRAHYYLGSIYRELGDARAAAEQLTATVKTNPGARFAYIDLAELYRRWGYFEQARAVATAGTTRVPVGDAAALWIEIAMSYEEVDADDKAIDALDKAIAIRPNDANPRLYRGWLLFRGGHLTAARRDLESVASSPDPRQAAARQRAEQLLAQLANGASPRDIDQTCKPLNGCRVIGGHYMDWSAGSSSRP